MTRLLVVDATRGTLRDTTTDELATLLMPGDLVVLNDAATLPASVRMLDAAGASHEARFAASPRDGRAHVVLFGPGDHRMRTEDRPAPRRFEVGETLSFDRIRAVVAAVSPRSPRLIELAFDAPDGDVVAAIIRVGSPVQYSHTTGPVPLYAVQTVIAARPWAVEMPSAARPLRIETLLQLRRRGVVLATLTHSAGLSSTGDEALDSALPLPERYEIPTGTAEAIVAARARGGRVVAVGTSVVRALEDCAARFGDVCAGTFVAELVIGSPDDRRVVDALLTGIHVEGESHHRLLGAFLEPALLASATAHAARERYRLHEFGDVSLVLCAPREVVVRSSDTRARDAARHDRT